MSTATQVKVERAIVHVVNHIRPQRSIKSKIELPLPSNERLRGYFETQIAKALDDSELSQAIFDDDAQGPDTAADYCLSALKQPQKFIDSSQKLADALRTAMGSDGRIKPESSSLAVCLYSQPSSAKKYLGLLKLDPSEALVQKIERDSSGDPLWVNFEVREDAMPTANERLQKAALIMPERSAEGHDLLLLDRQTTKEAANFFARKFLKARPILDAKKRTKRLYTALATAHNRLTPPQPIPGRPSLTLEESEEFRDEINSVMRRSKFDTSKWLQGLDLPDETKQVVEHEIHRQIPIEREFNLDPKYAQEEVLNPKRRIKGAYGVVFEVEAEHWKDVVKEVSRKVVGGHQVVRLQLEIPDYQEVLKK